jgi:phage tail-like protein
MAETAAPAAGTSVDPFRAYNFKLLIQGVTEGHFTACDGLSISVADIKYREGGNSEVVRRLPGPVEYGNIVLKYGLTASTELWTWFMTAVKGAVERRNVSIVVVDNNGIDEATRYNLINAWPSQWKGAPLDAMGREVAIESLTLVFETLDRA